MAFAETEEKTHQTTTTSYARCPHKTTNNNNHNPTTKTNKTNKHRKLTRGTLELETHSVANGVRTKKQGNSIFFFFLPSQFGLFLQITLLSSSSCLPQSDKPMP